MHRMPDQVYHVVMKTRQVLNTLLFLTGDHTLLAVGVMTATYYPHFQ